MLAIQQHGPDRPIAATLAETAAQAPRSAIRQEIAALRAFLPDLCGSSGVLGCPLDR